MKKLFLLILLLLTISCGITKKYSWESIGESASLIKETCRDTLNRVQLDSACFVNRIDNNLNNWSSMIHYNSKEDYIKQYVYTRPDTVYTITEYENLFIFTKRITINKTE